LDADPEFFSPDDVTRQLQPVLWDCQSKPFRNPSRGFYD
jgi:hypothetical protein